MTSKQNNWAVFITGVFDSDSDYGTVASEMHGAVDSDALAASIMTILKEDLDYSLDEIQNLYNELENAETTFIELH